MTNRPTVRSAYRDRPASVPLMGSTIGGAVFAVVALFALIGGMSIWWFYVRVNVTAEIQRDSFEFQQTSRDRIVDLDADLARIDVQLASPELTSEQSAALTAQRQAMAEQLCGIAAGLSGDLSPTHSQIITKEC